LENKNLFEIEQEDGKLNLWIFLIKIEKHEFLKYLPIVPY